MITLIIFIICLIAGVALSKLFFEYFDSTSLDISILIGASLTLMFFITTIVMLGEKEKWDEGYYMYYKGEVVVCEEFKVKWTDVKSTPVLINGEEVICQKRSSKRVLDEHGVIHD